MLNAHLFRRCAATASASAVNSLSPLAKTRHASTAPSHPPSGGSTDQKASTAMPPTPSRAAPQSSDEIAQLLRNPAVAREVILRLSPTKRRELLVAASYYEWFGDVIKEGDTVDFSAEDRREKEAVLDRPATCTSSTSTLSSSSSVASPSFYKASASSTGTITDSNNTATSSWEVMRRERKAKKAKEERYRIRKEMQEANPIPSLPMTEGEYTEWVKGSVQTLQDPGSTITSAIPARVLVKVALQTGLPFMAFGTLDNSMLILAGDMLDNWIGADLNLSTMGAAGLGGIVSGVVGIQIHGLAERAVTKYGPPPPALKPSQWRSGPVQSAIHWGGTFGLVLGLLCGMFPLLLISDSSSVRRAMGDDESETTESIIKTAKSTPH